MRFVEIETRTNPQPFAISRSVLDSLCRAIDFADLRADRSTHARFRAAAFRDY